jgi:predicted aspartyl protease
VNPGANFGGVRRGSPPDYQIEKRFRAMVRFALIRSARLVALVAIALGIAMTDALPAATTCSLVQLASLPLETHPDGEVSVPVSVNGKTVLLTIDTGSIYSSISFSAARALGLTLQINGGEFKFANNVPIFFHTQTDILNLGPASGQGLPLLIVPGHILENGAAGLLGPDIMRQFDVEFDFAGGKFNVFSPNACPASPVYWTHQPFSEVPMKVDREWHIMVPALLDGRAVTAALDTGASRSFMNFDVAKALFGWRENDPNLKSLVAEVNGTPARIYRYRFSSLVINGITIASPAIEMMPQNNFGGNGEAGSAQMVLGIGALRQMHLYIGYKAQMLYLTAAEAR